MDAGGRAAPAPGGLAAFTTSLWIAPQGAKAEGPGERDFVSGRLGLHRLRLLLLQVRDQGT